MAKTKAMISIAVTDLRLCFCICKMLVFSWRGSIVNFSPGTIVSNIARRETGLYQDEEKYKKVLILVLILIYYNF